MKYKIKWVIFRVGETHVLSFTLHFSYMCFLCYTGWQLCMYLYVHVPVCRCHGTSMHVWRPEDSFRCWSFLSVLFAVVYPCWLAHKLLGILLSVSPVTRGALGLQTCATVTSFYMDSWYSSSGPHAGSPSYLPSPLLYVLLYYTSWGQICFMSLFIFFLEEWKWFCIIIIKGSDYIIKTC